MNRRTLLMAAGALSLTGTQAWADAISDIAVKVLTDVKMSCRKDGAMHVPTVLSALGAHAGFGCQMAVRHAVKQGLISEKDAFIDVETADGETYYFGDNINQALLVVEASVYRQVATGAIKAGAKVLPDMKEIVGHVAKTVGGPEFGRLRVPPEAQPVELPIESLKRLWSQEEALLVQAKYDPLFTGWYFGTAARNFIAQSTAVAPETAFRIVMESAVAMSKINPARIGVKV